MWKNQKDPTEMEAESLMFQQVKVCVKQESPKNKGALVYGGLFLTVILGLNLMKCIRDIHEAL